MFFFLVWFVLDHVWRMRFYVSKWWVGGIHQQKWNCMKWTEKGDMYKFDSCFFWLWWWWWFVVVVFFFILDGILLRFLVLLVCFFRVLIFKWNSHFCTNRFTTKNNTWHTNRMHIRYLRVSPAVRLRFDANRRPFYRHALAHGPIPAMWSTSIGRMWSESAMQFGHLNSIQIWTFECLRLFLH